MDADTCATCGGDMTEMSGRYCSSQCRDER